VLTRLAGCLLALVDFVISPRIFIAQTYEICLWHKYG